MEAAYSRYSDYLEKRKATDRVDKSFLREQRYLSEQAELLKQEEQGRRLEAMKTYLEKQMGDKQVKKDDARAQKLSEKPHLEYVPTVPMGTEPEPEEEMYIKAALKKTLDSQVDYKQQNKAAAKADELQHERHALHCVAVEMQQARLRDAARRADRTEMLRSTWDRQASLKKVEHEFNKPNK